MKIHSLRIAGHVHRLSNNKARLNCKPMLLVTVYGKIASIMKIFLVLCCYFFGAFVTVTQ